MTGVVAGIGIKALAGSALKKAGSGVRAFFKWLGSLDALHVILLALAIFGAWQSFGRWSQHRHTVKVEAQLTTAANALTDARKQLVASQANEAALTKAISDQNAAIADLTRQKAAAGKALQAATARGDAATASGARLRASVAQRPAVPAANCEPPQSVKDQWGAK